MREYLAQSSISIILLEWSIIICTILFLVSYTLILIISYLVSKKLDLSILTKIFQF